MNTTANPNDYEELMEIASFIRQKLKITETPNVALILGTGLNHIATIINEARSVEYHEIPGFSVSTVKGHRGRLIYGTLRGKYVMCMQGRLHMFEGYSLARCAMPIRVLKLLGVETLLMTSAVGTVNRDFKVGDLMMVKDQVSLPSFGGRGPLTGPNTDELGPRFFGMVNAYDRDLRTKVKKLAVDHKFTSLREGIYSQAGGPMFETPAEIRALRILGADVVGMSVCHETVIARHCGLRLLVLALITNLAIDDTEGDSLADIHEEVLAMGAQRSDDVAKFIGAIMSEVL